MGFNPGDDIVRHAVDSFPETIRECRIQVERYQREMKERGTYLAALNLQVITRHLETLRCLQLAAFRGERVGLFKEGTGEAAGEGENGPDSVFGGVGNSSL